MELIPKMSLSMSLYLLNNFEIQKHDKKEPKFYGMYSYDHQPDIPNDMTYVINPN